MLLLASLQYKCCICGADSHDFVYITVLRVIIDDFLLQDVMCTKYAGRRYLLFIVVY